MNIWRRMILATLLVLAGVATAHAQDGASPQPAPQAAAPQPAQAAPPATATQNAPVQQVSTPQDVDTPLRIGDVLSVELPGEQAFTHPFQIDRKGAIQLPEVGAITIAGRTLPEAREDIREALSNAFRDLGKLSVTLKERKLLRHRAWLCEDAGKCRAAGRRHRPDGDRRRRRPRPGRAARPHAAAPRQRQARPSTTRGISTPATWPLLPELQPLDAIFVPASPLTGNVQIDFDGRTLAAAGDGGEERTSIKVFGEVNTPAIFACKQGANGHRHAHARGRRHPLRRARADPHHQHGKPVVFNLQAYLDTGDRRSARGRAGRDDLRAQAGRGGPPRRAHRLCDGRGRQARRLREQPGRHLHRHPRQCRRPDPLRRHAPDPHHPRRRQGRDGRPAAFTEGKVGKLPPVRPGDAIFVPEKTETQEPSWLKMPPSRAVQVMGAVRKPGRYEWSDEMSLFDLLAAGRRPDARAPTSPISRSSKSENDRAKPDPLRPRSRSSRAAARVDQVPRIHAGYVIMVPELPQDPSRQQGAVDAPGARPVDLRHGPGRRARPLRLQPEPRLPRHHLGGQRADRERPTCATFASPIAASGLARSARSTSPVLRDRRREALPRVQPGDVIFVPDRTRHLSISRLAHGSRARRGRQARPLPVQRRHDDPRSAGRGRRADQRRAAGQDHRRQHVQRPVAGAIFNLLGFAKTGDIRRLPVARATFMCPTSQDEWRPTRDDVKDIISAASLVSIIGALGLR